MGANHSRELKAMPDIAAAKTRLDKMLVELEGRQQRIGEDLDEPLNPDSSERAVEMEDDVSLEGQAVLLDREIASVKRALARIGDGSYGECMRCGESIDPARLEARPEAALCINCARETE
jgi:RNA polymerase-binding transcription factor DksA